MKTRLYYLFDPLCGWCYGATSAMLDAQAHAEASIVLSPTGLFAGMGARPMNSEFAAYAWSNDQRIEGLTGQRFTQAYRQQVLGDYGTPFDSGPATLALTAVFSTQPEQELSALKAIQQARYVHGQDITSLEVLLAVLRDQGLEAAAEKLAVPDASLQEILRDRVAKARELMQAHGINGVPAFVVERDGRRKLLQTNDIYTEPQALAKLIAAA